MFVIDAEAVFCAEDGTPDFEQPISRRVDEDVFAYGFDLLALDGEDLRNQPLERRKVMLARILRRSADGIILNEHMDGELGAAMFKHACRMGLEGIVSKRRDKPYQPAARRRVSRSRTRRARRHGGLKKALGTVERQLIAQSP
jgi:bifunctional non-homologous end joining protein LigD